MLSSCGIVKFGKMHCTVSLILLLLLSIGNLASPIGIVELPRKPQVSCNSTQTMQAITQCALPGAARQCCEGLDAVYGNQNSSAFGCLCYPRVLGAMVVEVHTWKLDLLALLERCKKDHQIKADWWRGANSSCPLLGMDDGVAEVLAALGEVGVVGGHQGWSWQNIKQGGDVMADPMMVDTVKRLVLGPISFKFILGLLMVLPLFFLVAHHLVLLRIPCLARGYQELTHLQQVVTCTHMVFALLLGLQLGPYTYYALRTLFKVWTAQFVTSTELAAIVGGFIMLHALMYLFEGCLRSINFSWLLLVHHEVFFLILGLGCWAENTGVLTIGVILDLFVVHEAPLYWALVAYRLGLAPGLVRGLLWGACGWYLITRLIQTAMLGYTIASLALMPAVQYTPEFIIASVLCGVLTVLQFYTITIFKSMYGKVGGPTKSIENKGSINMQAECA